MISILDGVRAHERRRRRNNIFFVVIVVLVALLVFALAGEFPELVTIIP